MMPNSGNGFAKRLIPFFSIMVVLFVLIVIFPEIVICLPSIALFRG